MIRVRQVKVKVEEVSSLKDKLVSKLRVPESDILDYRIIKESLDCRYKPELYYVYEIDVKVKNEEKLLRINNKDIFLSPNEEYEFNPTGAIKMQHRPVIVGSGPAGLFAAYMLAYYGYKPIVIERGECVEKRTITVDKFWQDGVINPESNVQFGEGGAGTFSDGKLKTSINDHENRIKKVLELFVEFGAPEEIKYKAMPHIGTDILKKVIVNMRQKIIELGGSFEFETKLTDISVNNSHLTNIEINSETKIECDVLVLAIGHSARDTFYMLNNYLIMEAKPFAIGVRVQHNQSMIDEMQYGKNSVVKEPATYKLTYTTNFKRGVYTFCMCPGGYVINSSSEKGMLAINGMSFAKRDSENANSAVIVTVTPDDFGFSPLAGIEYQRKLEQKAFAIAGGKIPVQLFRDYKDNKISLKFGKVNPIFKGEYQFANLNNIFPNYINESIKEAMGNFDKKIKGFALDDVILAGIESRTSSPVRIIRNDDYIANIDGIYPCGEGAGYAGGITSAAIDGIKVAEKIMQKYQK